MQNDESNEVSIAIGESDDHHCKEQGSGKDQKADAEDPSQENGTPSSQREPEKSDTSAVLHVVISQNEFNNRGSISTSLKVEVSKRAEPTKDEISRSTEPSMDEKPGAMIPKKVCLDRSDSYGEQCRVCQQETEEALVELGCQCRGELAKAHRSCIDIWFRTRGSNRCEICQQVAANIPLPESHPNSSYWVWRVDPTFRGSDVGLGDRERGCFDPVWVAFFILIGGLLLDVLISISLGVSALPVNIIIGVLIVLGLGTAVRLALECCHEWSLRSVRRVETDINPGYHPTV